MKPLGTEIDTTNAIRAAERLRHSGAALVEPARVPPHSPNMGRQKESEALLNQLIHLFTEAAVGISEGSKECAARIHAGANNSGDRDEESRHNIHAVAHSRDKAERARS